MSIPAAESWDVVCAAARAYRGWRQRHSARRTAKPEASADRDMRRENFAASVRSPFASSVLLSDAIQTCGLETLDDGRAR